MNKRHKPCRRRTRIVRVVRAIGARRSIDGGSLSRDADVTQSVQIVNNLVQPRFRVGCLVQSCYDCLDELTRQPYDALIFGLNPRPCLEPQPPNIDGQTEGEDNRE